MKIKRHSTVAVLTAEEVINEILAGNEETSVLPSELPSTYAEAVKAGWDIVFSPQEDGMYHLIIEKKDA